MYKIWQDQSVRTLKFAFGSSQGGFGQEMPLEVTIRVRSGNKTTEGNPGREKHVYKEIQAQEDMAYVKQVRFPGCSEVKASASNAGDPASIPGLGRWEDPLEEGMATHFTIPAWKIPWTEEPGGLQSMGSQTVGHD